MTKIVRLAIVALLSVGVNSCKKFSFSSAKATRVAPTAADADRIGAEALLDDYFAKDTNPQGCFAALGNQKLLWA